MIYFAGNILKQMKKFLEKKGSVISCVGNKKGNEIANFWRRMVVLMVNDFEKFVVISFCIYQIKISISFFYKKI
jgi:hypothetical protein